MRRVGGWRRSKGAKYLPGASGSASEPNLVQDGLANGQSDFDPQLGQYSGEQNPQQAAPSQLTMSRSSRFLGKIKRPFGRRNNATDQPLAMSTSQSLAIPTSVLARPHSSYSGTSDLKMHTPSLCEYPQLTAGGGHVTTGGAVSSGDHSSSPSRGPSFVFFSAPLPEDRGLQLDYRAPITNEDPAPHSICVLPHIPTPDTPAIIDLHETELPPPSPYSAVVWAKALEIVKKKLSNNNLPPLDTTNLTSQSAGENIETVVKALNTLQKDEKKKRWRYTWGGKDIIIVERVGKILKTMDLYSKAIDIAIQSNPQVSALVWAGVWVITQVCTQYTLLTY